jgi:hypothetical protein
LTSTAVPIASIVFITVQQRFAYCGPLATTSVVAFKMATSAFVQCLLCFTLCSLCLISGHAWINRLNEPSDLNIDDMEDEHDLEDFDVEKLSDDVQPADRSSVVVRKSEVSPTKEEEGMQTDPKFYAGEETKL